MPSDRPLSTEEVANVLGVIPRRVRQLRDKIGGYYYVGRMMFFPPRNVTRFARERQRKKKKRTA